MKHFNDTLPPTFTETIISKAHSVLHFLKFGILTFRTPNQIKKLYSKICQLDLHEPLHISCGILKASCSSLLFKSNGGQVIAVNEGVNGEVVAQELMRETNQPEAEFIDVYREGQFLISAQWAHWLKAIDSVLTKMDYYRIRETEALNESQQGMM